MEEIQVHSTNFSPGPSSNTNHYYSAPNDDGVRTQTDTVNANEEKTSCLHSVGMKGLLIAVLIAVSIIVIILVIVLPIVLTKRASSATQPTLQTTLSAAQQIITKCQAVKSISSAKKVTTSAGKTQHKKLKMRSALGNIENRVLIKDTYMVEFPCDSGITNHFQTVTKSLKASHDIQSSKIKKRYTFNSLLFCGVSFTVNDDYPIEAIEMIKDAVDIYPVYTVHLSSPSKRSDSADALNGKVVDGGSIYSFNLTGVTPVHAKLNNFGKGVKVAVIDSGVYYLHPALGGCFGPGCKVAFGYDFVGDYYGVSSDTPTPDNDPLDNCSDSSHGTHVAGIIAANTTGINQTGYIPSTSFSGVAPQVTIGAYRVFGCTGSSPTDAITQAIYRAYDDGADIINLSLGNPLPYSEGSDSIAVQRVTDNGVYVVSAAGNEGHGGFQTINAPGLSSGTMAVASLDNTYTLKPYIITPDGSKIVYEAGVTSRGWQTIVNSTIVVNDPNSTVDDGCFGLSKPVSGAVVLFYISSDDQCDVTTRCDQAAIAGAIGCLIYNAAAITGASTIPSGAIGLNDGLNIIATVAANASAIYSFTGLLEPILVETVGTPSWFTSLGLTADLLFKPQISGIGGNVYSTVSPYYAALKKLAEMYDIESGTSMATPYVAGTLALFLASIGNPAPNTTGGYATNGICRPSFSVATNIFQSTASIANLYSSSLFASTAQQGAGLVNAYRALTVTTLISPSQLSLNDTVRKNSSYTINVFNIGNEVARYKTSHSGAALATGKTPDDDQLLTIPLYSADYATVVINPTDFELQPGQSRNITLQFTAPANVNPALLPIYSGFIYVKNQVNGEVFHTSYAGVVGDFGNARILVQNSSSDFKTGILNASELFISDDELSTLNATEPIKIRMAIAWPTRIFFAEAVSINDNSLLSFNSSYRFICAYNSTDPVADTNLPRNVGSTQVQSYLAAYPFEWGGEISLVKSNTNSSVPQTSRLPPGQYRIRFAVLKHFGNDSNPNDFEVYNSPPFNLVY